MATFKRIKAPRIRLADEVYQQIVHAIHVGDITPDQRLVQEKLASELEISRTPIREALLRLEQEGVLKTSNRGGFIIRQVELDEVREIYQTRCAIEGYAASLLAAQGNSNHFAQIEAIISQEESRNLVTAADFYDANKNIHRAFVERTQNRFLLDMFDQMWNRGFSLHMFAKIKQEELKKSLGEHKPILDILRKGDAAAAEAAMRAHIGDGLTLQLQSLNPSEG